MSYQQLISAHVNAKKQADTASALASVYGAKVFKHHRTEDYVPALQSNKRAVSAWSKAHSLASQVAKLTVDPGTRSRAKTDAQDYTDRIEELDVARKMLQDDMAKNLKLVLKSPPKQVFSLSPAMLTSTSPALTSSGRTTTGSALENFWPLVGIAAVGLTVGGYFLLRK